MVQQPYNAVACTQHRSHASDNRQKVRTVVFYAKILRGRYLFKFAPPYLAQIKSYSHNSFTGAIYCSWYTMYSPTTTKRSLVADLLGEDDHTQSYVSSQKSWRSISRDWRHVATPFSHDHILLPFHHLILKNDKYSTFRWWGTTTTYCKIFSKLDTIHTLYPPCPKSMTQPIFLS